MRRLRHVGVVAALACAAACAGRPRTGFEPTGAASSAPAVVARAIAARGGPIAALVRESDVRVAMGFPGDWHWRTVTAPPERYAWTIETNDQPNHYLFDGRTVRAYVGDTLVSEDASPASPLRTHARFAAVAALDVLATGAARVTIASAAREDVALHVVFPDRGDAYDVALDGDSLVTRVAGPIDLSPLARGRLVAVYDDYRTVDDRRIAHHVTYTLDDAPLADERVVAACVLTSPPDATAFATPSHIPRCK